MKTFAILWAFIPVIVVAAPGDLDRSFHSDGVAIYDYSSSAVGMGFFEQPDGKMIIEASEYTNFPSTPALRQKIVFRIHQDGSVDSGFGTSGKIVSSYSEDSVWAVGPDGTLYVFDSSGSMSYTKDGQVRAGYTDQISSSILSISRKPVFRDDGLIIVAFTSTNPVSSATRTSLIAIDSSGDISNSFNSGSPHHLPDGAYHLSAICFDPSGAVYVATQGATSEIFRLTAEGTLDTTYGNGGSVELSQWITSLCAASSGELYFSGSGYDSDSGTDYAYIGRLLSTGNLDTSFSSDGIASYTEPGGNTGFNVDCKVLDNGQPIMLTDYYLFTQDPAESGFSIIRFDHSGNYDTSFGLNGITRISFYDETFENDIHIPTYLGLGKHGKLMAVGLTTPDYGPEGIPTYIAACVIEGLSPSDIGSAAPARLNLTQTNPNILFNSNTIYTYSLWGSLNPNGPWSKLGEQAGDGTELSFEDLNGLSSRYFYQIRED